MDSGRREKRVKLLICIGLVAATFAAYEPTLHNGFVNYDDDKYITQNPRVTGGITPDSVVWAFTQPHYYMWHPLTTLSHMLDCQLFGLNASLASPCQLVDSYCQRPACFLDSHQFNRVNLAQCIHRGDICAAPDAGGIGGVGSRAKNGAKRAVLVSNNIRLYLVHKTAGHSTIYISVSGLRPLYYDQTRRRNASACPAFTGLLAS